MIQFALKSRLFVAAVTATFFAALCYSSLAAPVETSAAPVETSHAGGTASRLGLRIIQSGHSLTDPIPPLLRAFAISAGANPDVVIDRSTIPGSPMDYRWEHVPNPPMPNARTAIGNYDLLVITERSSLSGTMQWHNSASEALRWFEHAHIKGAGGKGAETILYSTWVEIVSGPGYENPYNDPEAHIPWRDRLPLEFARWIEIADFVNSNLPDGAAPMQVIPATLVLAAAYDDIVAGKAPGLSDIQELFLDDIHLNDAGAYLVSLAHYAVIYDLDPRGLPNHIDQQATVPKDMAAWMQDLVRDVVGTYQSAARQRYEPGAELTTEQFHACIWEDLRRNSVPCA